MELALSSHWNTGSHGCGEAVIAEIIEAGFTSVELGYDLTVDLVPGIKRMVESGDIRVVSVHNFCPVPIGAPRGHPELFSLCATDARERTAAVKRTTETIEFAADVEASCVVVHAGRVEMKHLTPKLISLAEAGKQYDRKFEKVKLKLMMGREKRASRHMQALVKSVEELMPALERTGLTMALENLPSWEAIPNEIEAERLLSGFSSPRLGYWHDIGHGRIRHNLGLISEMHWLEKLSPWLAGFHIHDVAGPAMDHLMPPRGDVDFSVFKPFITSDTLLVMEPAPGTPPGQIREGAEALEEVWGNPG